MSALPGREGSPAALIVRSALRIDVVHPGPVPVGAVFASDLTVGIGQIDQIRAVRSYAKDVPRNAIAGVTQIVKRDEGAVG